MGEGARIAQHTIGESHGHLEHATLPHSLLLAGNAALPDLEVHHAVLVLGRAGPEAERMVLSPLLSGTRKVSPEPMLNTGRVRRRVGADNVPLFGEAHLTESHNRVSVCVGRGGDGRRMGEHWARRTKWSSCRTPLQPENGKGEKRCLRPMVGCLTTGLESGMDMVKPNSTR